MVVIAKHTIDDEIGLAPGAPYVVMCVSEHRGNRDLYVFNDDLMAIPYSFSSDLFDLIDDSKPANWTVVDRDGSTIMSFPEWVDEPLFYNYLLEDTWKPAKTKWAYAALLDEYTNCLNEYAVKKFGTLDMAKILILKQQGHDVDVDVATMVRAGHENVVKEIVYLKLNDLACMSPDNVE